MDEHHRSFGYHKAGPGAAGQHGITVRAKGVPLDLAALFLWIVTAVAGLNLLVAGKPADRSDDNSATEPVLTGAGVPAAAAAAYSAGAGTPPINHTRITTRPDEHPLLEFIHPALGMIGLGCWAAFVVTGFRTFAWMAFGVIVVTIGAGLSWFFRSRSAARHHAAGSAYPPRLILLHGSAAVLTLLLAVVTALSAAHS
jgi:hypothetical protein